MSNAGQKVGQRDWEDGMQARQQRACLTMELVVTARYQHAADYVRLPALTASARRIEQQREGAAGAAASNRQLG